MIRSFFWSIWTTYFRLFEWLRVVCLYYCKQGKFVRADILLASQYLLQNPHRISKRFLQSRGESNPYQYGETPLTTLDKIAIQCGILSQDTVVELGCGSGRTLFWLNSFVGCSVIGIDFLPAFIEKGRWVAEKLHFDRVSLRCEDLFEADLSKATVIYLYGTCLEDTLIEKLAHRLAKLDPPPKIITVSYPLSDYHPGFVTHQSFSGRFPWGSAEIFLQTSRSIEKSPLTINQIIPFIKNKDTK